MPTTETAPAAPDNSLSPLETKLRSKTSKLTRINSTWCYIFLIPALLLTAGFTFYPMIMSWVYSTMDWPGFTSPMNFVGFDNYAELLQDQQFWNAFGRSLIFVLVGTPLRVILALALALVLNAQVMKLSSTFRMFFFLPVISSAAIIGVVMTFVLSPNGGPANTALQDLGIINAPIEFLSDPNQSLWTALLVHTWKNFGTTLIYWLAALQTVPKEYLEAATVDGANKLKILRHITIPLLIPFAIIIIVLTAKENLTAFGIIQAMTQGGPYFSSETIEVYIYRMAFAAGVEGGVPRLGFASAAGCFFGVMTLLLALTQVWAVRAMAQKRKSAKPASEEAA